MIVVTNAQLAYLLPPASSHDDGKQCDASIAIGDEGPATSRGSIVSIGMLWIGNRVDGYIYRDEGGRFWVDRIAPNGRSRLDFTQITHGIRADSVTSCIPRVHRSSRTHPSP